MAARADGRPANRAREEKPMADNTDLQSPITAVTVYRDGARVTRSTTTALLPGLRSVALGNLPDSADPESVRVAVRGEQVALLEVEVNRRYGADPVRDETVRLRSEAERCRDAVRELDDADAAEQARLGFAKNLSAAAATAMARAVSFGRASRDELNQMAEHLAGSTASALASRRDISARRRTAQRELEAAEQRLADAEERSEAAEFIEVAATIEAAAAADAEIEVSYHVAGASWEPLYDLALSGEHLSASYLAEVTQRTGEDWPPVRIVLSTSRQGLSQTLPELDPWYISRLAPAPMRGRMARAAAKAPAELSVALAGTAEPAAAPLMADVDEAGISQVYRVTRPIAVPADGNPHKTAIAQFDLDATLDYLAVPVVAPEAYLRAKVTNGSALLLLPGRARIFKDGQFTGETTLETVAPGEEFELQLGVDDQIRIERKLVRRATSKAVIGASRTVDIGYETTVASHRPGSAKVSVHDHIPVSTDGEIRVRLREASPPAEHDDLGELIWDLMLAEGQTTTIRYRFTVEHPGQVTVTGI
jgi:uncharacterized protein (TIGR02231 family)